MTVTYGQLATISDNTEFQERVREALNSAAVAVYAEASNTTGHVARAAFAQLVTRGNYDIKDICLAVLSNLAIQAEANPAVTPDFAIPDSDIQFAVNSIWNLLSGA